MIKEHKSQSGFTLIELMIAMIISLIVVGATITMFVMILKSNSDNLKMIRLTQEMRSVMSLISRDIRRTGYWDGDVSVNPYLANWPANDNLGTLPLAYDANSLGDNDAGDSFEYEINNEEVFISNNGNTSSLTDPDFTRITELNFEVEEIVLTGVSIRNVVVTLSAEIQDDPQVNKTLTERIRVRNDAKL